MAHTERISRLSIAMVGLRAPWGVAGGVEAMVAAVAPRLARAGLEVTVYCRRRYNTLGPGMHEGVRLVDVGTTYHRTSEALLHTLICVPRASLHHDIVHLHAAGPAWLAPLARLTGRKVVVTLHGEDWQRAKWGPAARTVLRLGAEVGGRSANALVVVSSSIATWASRYGEKVEYIPNGTEPHVATPWSEEVFPAIQPGRYHLFLGRLVPEKGLARLIEAARLLHGDPIAIVGGASHTERFARTLQEEAPKNVLFLGPRFGHEKGMLLTHARSFLLPSETEGMPIALLEAMAAGLPVLASPIPPVMEALGGTGRPVGPTSRAWADAITEIERLDEAERRALGEAGQRRVQQTYTWERTTQRYMDIYRRLATSS